MTTWIANIVTTLFTCEASSEEEAELKYHRYFISEDGSCCAPKECSCEISDSDTSHLWTTSTTTTE